MSPILTCKMFPFHLWIVIWEVPYWRKWSSEKWSDVESIQCPFVYLKCILCIQHLHTSHINITTNNRRALGLVYMLWTTMQRTESPLLEERASCGMDLMWTYVKYLKEELCCVYVSVRSICVPVCSCVQLSLSRLGVQLVSIKFPFGISIYSTK